MRSASQARLRPGRHPVACSSHPLSAGANVVTTVSRQQQLPRPPRRPRPGGHQDPPAGHLGQRGLRRHRHHPEHRRRVALRGGRPPRRPEGPRRRLRERSRHPRRGAPFLQGDRPRLRASRCWPGARSAPGRSGWTSPSSRVTPRRSRSSTRQFDAAISTFGVMFTPDHPRAARELARVVRPGGKIGLASWTPDGFIGQLFALVGRTAPPPAGLRPPSLWGTVPHCEELFDGSGLVDEGPAPRVRVSLPVGRAFH